MATSELSTQRSDPIPSGRLATRDGISYRLGAASGIVFIVLLVVTIAITRFPSDSSDAGLLKFFADPGVRAAEQAHFYLVVAGCLFLLWFVSTMKISPVTLSPGTEAIAQLSLLGVMIRRGPLAAS